MLKSKLQFPIINTDIIDRPRVVSLFEQGADKPLILVSTPAGYQLYASHDSTGIDLTAWLPDQSALMGVLQTLHELHYRIISVNSIK